MNGLYTIEQIPHFTPINQKSSDFALLFIEILHLK